MREHPGLPPTLHTVAMLLLLGVGVSGHAAGLERFRLQRGVRPQPAVVRAVAPVARGPAPPKTPKGLPPCHQVLRPPVGSPRAAGETIRYLVEVDGLSVGTIDFKVERRGAFEGREVTEYRSLFKLDSLVSVLMPVEGRAAALVPAGGFWPVKAMNRYRLNDDEFEEEVTWGAGGDRLDSRRLKNGKARQEQRRFIDPTLDFVSAFYLVRALPQQTTGCSVIYGNQRAYTIWLTADGQEQVKTPVGMRQADRFRVRYGSDKSKKLLEGKVWLGEAPARLPYRAELYGKRTLRATVHLYEVGK